MKRRILVNLLAFAAVSTVVIVWSFTTLFEVDALDDPDFVTAEFESSPGLARGFEVAYLGHAVGSIHSVELRDGFSEAGVDVPDGDVRKLADAIEDEHGAVRASDVLQ